MNALDREHSSPRQIWWMPLLLLTVGCWPYCQLGGGTHSNSVTVPGKDGVHLQAEATGGGTSARIVLERETREISMSGEVTYVFDKTLTTQELQLEINEGDDPFILAEHDAASGYESHRLDVAPDGKRVAYRLDDEPWRVVYLLTKDVAVHGPYETNELAWKQVPTLAEDFIEVFDAHSLRMDGLYRFEKKDDLLTWLHAHADEGAVVDALFGLVPKEDHQWRTHVLRLSDSAQAKLRDRLRASVKEGAAHPLYYTRAIDIRAVDVDKLPADSVGRAVESLMKFENTVRNDGIDLAEYLRVHARHDPGDAAKRGCELLAIEAPLAPNGRPYALDLGRPLQLVALAAVAATNRACSAVEGLPDGRCTACGSACSETTLTDAIRMTLTTRLEAPEIGETPSDEPRLRKLSAAVQRDTLKTDPGCD